MGKYSMQIYNWWSTSFVTDIPRLALRECTNHFNYFKRRNICESFELELNMTVLAKNLNQCSAKVYSMEISFSFLELWFLWKKSTVLRLLNKVHKSVNKSCSCNRTFNLSRTFLRKRKLFFIKVFFIYSTKLDPHGGFFRERSSLK